MSDTLTEAIASSREKMTPEQQRRADTAVGIIKDLSKRFLEQIGNALGTAELAADVGGPMAMLVVTKVGLDALLDCCAINYRFLVDGTKTLPVDPDDRLTMALLAVAAANVREYPDRTAQQIMTTTKEQFLKLTGKEMRVPKNWAAVGFA